MHKRFILLLLAAITSFQAIAQTDYYVTDFGAVDDGIYLNTRIIQSAIDFVSENGGGRLIFPSGKYLTGSIYLKSDVTLHLEQNAVILGSTNPLDYVKDPYVRWMSLIFSIKQDNIGITGTGTIDGQGFTTAYNQCENVHKGLFNDNLRNDRPNETNRPENIYFRECTNVLVEGITLKDPASWNQTYDRCINVTVQNITVDSKSYWNNDGIDIVDCNGVIVRNCDMDAADDVFCLKSHNKDCICQNVVIENCRGRSSANGLKFGTVSQGGFKNITIRNLEIYDTYRSAITLAAVDGGIIEDVDIDGVRAINTGNAIYLRTGKRNKDERIGTMNNVLIKNVYVEVPATKPDKGYSYEGPVEDLPRNISPAGIVGIEDSHIKNVTLENVEIIYPDGSDPNYAYCGTDKESLKSVPEMIASYPEFSQFKELPAWGLYIRHAENITLKNVTFTAKGKEYRPAIVADDVSALKLEKINISEPDSKNKKQIIKNNVRK